jgi:SMC interacting uncharacterized protein involved in chromosome segregation
MAELDKIPQTSTVELATVTLDEAKFKEIKDFNEKANLLINDFGQIYVRKRELNEELDRMDSLLEKAEADFKETNLKLKEVIAELEQKYPAGRLNLQDGTITYQPGAQIKK